MAALVAAQPPRWKLAALSSLGRFGLGIVVRGLARLRRSIEIRQARRALQGFPDYLLKDIGIRRCEIHSIAEMLVDNPSMEPRRPRRTLAY